METLLFNPSEDKNVERIKKLYAEIIDIYVELSATTNNDTKRRFYDIAITEAQGAQMWAVKAITWKE